MASVAPRCAGVPFFEINASYNGRNIALFARSLRWIRENVAVYHEGDDGPAPALAQASLT